MRLVNFRADGEDSFGVATATGVVDLRRRLDDVSSLRSLIAGKRLEQACTALAAAGGEQAYDFSFDSVELLPPITDPEKIWCVGVNYAERNAEYKDGTQQPQYPSLFARNIRSFDSSLVRPRVSEQLDYEGEIVLVVGSAGRHLPAESALDHIFGVTLCNEGTVRDWLRHGKFNVTQGKNFDRSGSLGPWIVTADAVDLSGPSRHEVAPEHAAVGRAVAAGGRECAKDIDRSRCAIMPGRIWQGTHQHSSQNGNKEENTW